MLNSEHQESQACDDFTFHHLAISVPNLTESVRWYTEVLGFRNLRSLDIPNLNAKVAVLRRGTMHIELFEVHEAVAPSGNRSDPHEDLQTLGNKHVGFAVGDVRAFAASIRERGAEIISITEFEFGTNAFVRDNAGNILEFVQAQKS